MGSQDLKDLFYASQRLWVTLMVVNKPINTSDLFTHTHITHYANFDQLFLDSEIHSFYSFIDLNIKISSTGTPPQYQRNSVVPKKPFKVVQH